MSAKSTCKQIDLDEDMIPEKFDGVTLFAVQDMPVWKGGDSDEHHGVLKLGQSVHAAGPAFKDKHGDDMVMIRPTDQFPVGGAVQFRLMLSTHRQTNFAGYVVPETWDGVSLYAYNDVTVWVGKNSEEYHGFLKFGQTVQATGPAFKDTYGYSQVMIKPTAEFPVGGTVQFGLTFVKRPELPSRPWQGPQMQGEEFMAAVKVEGFQGLLERAGGIVQVTNFLPSSQATEALRVLEASKGDPDWELSQSYEPGDAVHAFWTCDSRRLENIVVQHLQAIDPCMHSFFKCSRYESGGKIDLHNDAMEIAITEQEATQGGGFHASGTLLRRKIACIYYLTQDWREEYGGLLVDYMEDGPRHIVPPFNSMVAFLVPREHYVTPMSAGAPHRHTVFGWFKDTDEYPSSVSRPLGFGNPVMKASTP
jgi:hypothetical protein